MRALFFALLLLAGCGEIWNEPYPASERGRNILYSVFAERPKHLDPAQSYASDEAIFTRQIYEPPLQYHYLQQPYELIPLTAAQLPRARTLEGGKYTVYEIRIRPGIRYQPHPGFVAENLSLPRERIEGLRTPYDLPTGTRELVADDYIYQIKRLAHPRLHSPIFGLMAEYVVGLAAFAGVMAAPIYNVSPQMGADLIIVVFAVVVIGGMGSIAGALAGALLIGLIRAFGSIGFPLFTDGLMFLFMALILIAKPSGLFGKDA